jgi:hypothetical protein
MSATFCFIGQAWAETGRDVLFLNKLFEGFQETRYVDHTKQPVDNFHVLTYSFPLRCLTLRNILHEISCLQPQTYVIPEAAITVYELLMMSGMSLETC